MQRQLCPHSRHCNLIAHFLSGLDTTLYWPASVMNGAPFVLYFFPYYLSASPPCSFIWHVSHAWPYCAERKIRWRSASSGRSPFRVHQSLCCSISCCWAHFHAAGRILLHSITRCMGWIPTGLFTKLFAKLVFSIQKRQFQFVF